MYADSIRFLFSLGPELKTVKWDLDRIRLLLGELGNPHTRVRHIHVAGTNGKGSVCAMIESSLRLAGYRTGLYTSPHLVSPRERIRIAGEMISEDAWSSTFDRVHAAAEHLLAIEAIDAHPSFFETVTAMAFLAFAEAAVDIVVLETGLGGRLDATNVVTPELSVITPIDFDHEAFLGSAIESIAAEKAGIIKPDRPVVFAAQRPAARSVLEQRALQVSSPVTLSSSLRVDALTSGRFGSRFSLMADVEIPVVCPLPGEHQVENARTAAAALLLFGLAPAAIAEGIRRVRWPGRLDFLARDPDIVADGAHNPAGAKALAAWIRDFCHDPVCIIFGAMRDKAIEEVTATLFPLAERVILTAPAQPRALNPETLAETVDHPNLSVAPNLAAALKLAAEDVMAKKMTTIVTGSLFLVGEAEELFSDRIRS